MRFGLAIAAIAAMLVAPGLSRAATYDYLSRPMLLVKVPGGYSLYGETIDLPEEKSAAISFSIDPALLGNRVALTRVEAFVGRLGDDATARAFRGGREIARQDPDDPDSEYWFSMSGPIDTFGASLWVQFDARSDVEAFGYSTDGETTTLSLGGARDSLISGTAADWVPRAPEWLSDGPGEWSHTPVPVPAPAGAALLLSALGAVGALRSLRNRTRRPRTVLSS